MLDNLSPDSRVWIFQAERFLTASEKEQIQNVLSDFVPKWAAHGNELYGGFEVVDPLFIVIGVDEAKAPPSGCSIDSMMKTVQELEKQLNISFLNRLNTAYIDETDAVKIANQETLKNLIRSGDIDGNTIVYNNLVQTKSELESSWKTPLKNSWHKNFLQLV